MPTKKKTSATNGGGAAPVPTPAEGAPSAAVSSAASERIYPGPNEVKIRLYGQGLGDCFLLAFPRPGHVDNPCYVVIDCGAAMSTPDRVGRAKKVVQDIQKATGGHIAVLAVTHQHFDHVSGFIDAWQEWNAIQVDTIYLPWTEAGEADPGMDAPEHKSRKSFRDALNKAAGAALDAAKELGFLDSQPGLRAQSDFLGVTPGAGKWADHGPGDMGHVMDFVRDRCRSNIRYLYPGDVLALPGTECHTYVLGPPTNDLVRDKNTARNPDGKKFIELLVDDDEGVMYSYKDKKLDMKVDDGKPGGSNAFALSDDRGMAGITSGLLARGNLSDATFRDSDEGFCPFAPAIRLDWDFALESDFFRAHYGDTTPGERSRRVDNDWLRGAANLALRAGDFTNNVSLVLAFGVPNSDKILLFPGDAQVGNWLSWHAIQGWQARDGSLSPQAPASNDKQTLMENLLSRVAFYKVGHHGSHNATIRDQGLEMMTRSDLIAYIPVSVGVAQDLMGYCPMPFYPVLRALHERTGGRVFLPNGHTLRLPGTPDNEARLLADAHITVSTDIWPAVTKKVKDETITVEEAMPLYLDIVLTGDSPAPGQGGAVSPG